MKVQQNSSPLYAVSYRRDGQSFADKSALFANWMPDTLDKTLYKEDQKVGIVYTKLRNHTVGEALKETISDVAPGFLVLPTLMGAVGTLIGVGLEMTGHAGAAMIGGLSGAGLGAGLLTLGGIAEYRGFRRDAGEERCAFSGYAYRERADQKEVKLISGLDLASKQDEKGFIIGGAAPTAHGYCEIKSLGRMP
ncbi:hypothetical protein JST97_38440 [bacterium]|nr:hypothetical protein [bacterium]